MLSITTDKITANDDQSPKIHPQPSRKMKLTYTKLDGTRNTVDCASEALLNRYIESLRSRCPAGHDLAIVVEPDLAPSQAVIDALWAEEQRECATGDRSGRRLPSGFDIRSGRL